MNGNCTTADSSRKSRPPKPPRPNKPDGCLLYPHPTGRWATKLRGKFYYYSHWVVWNHDAGCWERPADDGLPAALEKFAKDFPAEAQRASRPVSDALQVKDICNAFLTAQLDKLASGDIGKRMFDEYRATCERIARCFGSATPVAELTAADFRKLRRELAQQFGVVRQGNEVQKVRTIFKWAYDAGLIDQPIRFGPDFRKPSARALRLHRNESGQRMLEAEECRRLLDAADTQLRAMFLLGLNCAFGNHDVATLPLSAIDLARGWVDFPRPKTGIARRCKLWGETITALKAVIVDRPQPKQPEAEPLVFVTSRGRPWLSGGIANPVSVAARRLMHDVGVNGRRGIGFYTLRHVHRTIADGALDPVASALIMGHVDAGIAATYRERVDDARLIAVTEHVRVWLFGQEGGAK